MSTEHVTLPVVPGSPPELIVYDRLCRCPYLADRVARMPLRLPARKLRRSELDQRLEVGDRRQGLVLYRTQCPSCQACVPIRIPVQRFELSRGQRRILARGDRLLTVTVGPPSLDDRRVELYDIHKRGRGLSDGQPAIDAEGYEDFLVNTCCDTIEIRYSLAGTLVGVAVTDRAKNSLSAVYCYYDPSQGKLSLGTYSILKQIDLCRRLGLRWLYLGLYIAESPVMAYKARFRPHEQLIQGRWIPIEKTDPLLPVPPKKSREDRLFATDQVLFPEDTDATIELPEDIASAIVGNEGVSED